MVTLRHPRGWALSVVLFLAKSAVRSFTCSLSSVSSSWLLFCAVVVIVGAIIVMGEAKESDILSLILGFIAVILGTLNVVGG